MRIVLNANVLVSDLLVAPDPLPHSLPDPDDEAFLAVAIAGDAVCLVTGNLDHFPARLRQGVRVLSPAGFLKFCRRQNRKT